MIGNKFLKRIMAGFSGIAMAFSIIPNFSAFADDTHANYECVLFAQGTDDSIRINSQSISINGDIVTNGTFSTNSEYSGIYGNVFDNQGNSMIDYQSTIEELYFYDDVNYIEYNYDSTNENENIIMPTFVEGSFSNGYNVSITDSALMTIDDITICGNTFNATNSVLYSQLGDIHVETDVFSSSGLIYAPFGTVYIESGNVNINGLVIAQNIEI
ncbi:MAG: hypothetical protein K2G83_00570, partial [Ruminococcus sp.]|nr:hypothetical protein [Ruminococcus sp.]